MRSLLCKATAVIERALIYCPRALQSSPISPYPNLSRESPSCHPIATDFFVLYRGKVIFFYWPYVMSIKSTTFLFGYSRTTFSEIVQHLHKSGSSKQTIVPDPISNSNLFLWYLFIFFIKLSVRKIFYRISDHKKYRK